MKLRKLISHTRHVGTTGFQNVEVRDVVNDSRLVGALDLFVAVKGAGDDGAKYAAEAVRRGAVAVVACEPPEGVEGVPLILVKDAREALSSLSAVIHGHPSTRMKVIGVTGTNGKTSVSIIVRSILRQAGKETGLLGTISYEIGACKMPATVTTPESCDIQRFLAQMCISGCTYGVMEVSSHALEQKRVNDVDFDAAVFTNLTSEHLDYHGCIEDYFEAKAKLFRMLRPSARAVINADVPYGAALARVTKAAVTYYGLERRAEVSARIRSVDLGGSRYTMLIDGAKVPVHSALPGRHNILNALAAAAVCWRMGISLDDIRDGIEAVERVEGRLENVGGTRPFRVLVDYAHTEDALNTVLACVRPLVSGRLITVFGCGGERDRTKRAPMAAAAQRWSDLVVVTSDNPRTEDPLDIIGGIEAGFTPEARYIVEPDRAAAIAAAIGQAREGDLVLIAGKGHEKVQKFGDGEIPFDDRAVANGELEKMKSEKPELVKSR